MNFGCNAGLSKATALLGDVKRRHPTVSWADLIQMAGALAVELTGGPNVDMRYGREDAKDYTAKVRIYACRNKTLLFLNENLPTVVSSDARFSASFSRWCPVCWDAYSKCILPHGLHKWRDRCLMWGSHNRCNCRFLSLVWFSKHDRLLLWIQDEHLRIGVGRVRMCQGKVGQPDILSKRPMLGWIAFLYFYNWQYILFILYSCHVIVPWANRWSQYSRREKLDWEVDVLW